MYGSVPFTGSIAEEDRYELNSPLFPLGMAMIIPLSLVLSVLFSAALALAVFKLL